MYTGFLLCLYPATFCAFGALLRDKWGLSFKCCDVCSRLVNSYTVRTCDWIFMSMFHFGKSFTVISFSSFFSVLFICTRCEWSFNPASKTTCVEDGHWTLTAILFNVGFIPNWNTTTLSCAINSRGSVLLTWRLYHNNIFPSEIITEHECLYFDTINMRLIKQRDNCCSKG